MTVPLFYLGCHEPAWLAYVDVPLFVSRRRLARRKRLPVAVTNWSLDSGGFTELSTHGRWTIEPAAYVDEVRRYAADVGRMDWAAPQDWMTEPSMLARTGLTVAEHQTRTTDNYLDLVGRAPDIAWIPVLQGQTIGDYHRHADQYPLDLTRLPLVGLGSVCRRQATRAIGEIVVSLYDRGLRLHGFGCKAGAIRRYGSWLTSADSLAWSYGGRRDGTCLQNKSKCGDCLHWAMAWRDGVLAAQPAVAIQTALAI